MSDEGNGALDGSQGNTGATNDNSGNDGNVTSFLDTLTSDELKTNEHLLAFKDKGIEGLAADYVNLKTSQPQIPENPDGYAFEWPSDVPQDEKGFNDFRQLAHDLKLPSETWQKIVQFDIDRGKALSAQYEADSKKASEEKVETAAKALKAEWGNKYDENITKAKMVISKTKSDELLADRDLGNHPALAKLLVWVADSISEDKITSGGMPPKATQELGEDGKPLLHFPSMAGATG